MTLQEQHIIYEAIKIQRIEKGPDIFVDEEGDARASPSFDACTSWIFLGVTWASPSLSFCPYFISFHHSSLPTLENFLHTKLNTILISSICIIKIINPLGFSYDIYKASIITSATVALLQKALSHKRTKKEKDLEANANSGRNLSKQNSL